MLNQNQVHRVVVGFISINVVNVEPILETLRQPLLSPVCVTL